MSYFTILRNSKLLFLPVFALMLLTSCATQKWYGTNKKENKLTNFSITQVSVEEVSEPVAVVPVEKPGNATIKAMPSSKLIEGVSSGITVLQTSLGLAKSISQSRSNRRKVRDTLSTILEGGMSYDAIVSGITHDIRYELGIIPFSRGMDLVDLDCSAKNSINYVVGFELNLAPTGVSISLGSIPFESKSVYLPVLLNARHHFVSHSISIPVSGEFVVTDSNEVEEVKEESLGLVKFILYESYRKGASPSIKLFGEKEFSTLSYTPKSGSKITSATFSFGGVSVITNESKSKSSSRVDDATSNLEALNKLVSALSKG